MRKVNGQLIFSPTDLVTYLASPFSSWMDRYHLENPGEVKPDDETEDERLVAQIGDEHERLVLEELRTTELELVEIPKADFNLALAHTCAAIEARSKIIYQGALQHGRFAGYSDFLLLDDAGHYQVWDTKLARAPKPYYAIQLCCYSEMLAPLIGGRMPAKFGIILGSKERVEFRVEDFFSYYLRIKANFLTVQDEFTGNLAQCPEPQARAEHRRWKSHANEFFSRTDALVQVAGISIGQIKKLKAAGIKTATSLASASGKQITKLAAESLEKLAAQARLQLATKLDRASNPDAPPRFEILPVVGANGESKGLATLPPHHPCDVFFDMEGYPLVSGGLEYLFGAWTESSSPGRHEFHDWWAHDRGAEKVAFEGFVDWVYNRWKKNPGMHIYHYAAYEASALRRLSTFHDTRQDEVDDLLRNEVLIDLFQIVSHGLRVGEDSYSIKKIELLYRPKRATSIATAVDSIVQYARWIQSKQPGEWTKSAILKGIRDYNEDDCRSTAELAKWLRTLAGDPMGQANHRIVQTVPIAQPTLPPEVVMRLDIRERLRQQGDEIALGLADLIDFHRREEKPMWWRMFDRAEATPEALRDDAGCIEGIRAVGAPAIEKQSLIQYYAFDPGQECKLVAGDNTDVMFSFNLEAKLKLVELDASEGRLALKIGKKGLTDKFSGSFPPHGSLIPYEYVPAKSIQIALSEVCAKHLNGRLHEPVAALLRRIPPTTPLRHPEESVVEAAIRITKTMRGGCLVVQGPPGTGKSYTASRVIASLLADGKRVGVASNSHKVVVNLLVACGAAAREQGRDLIGLKVGGESTGQVFSENPSLRHINATSDAGPVYSGGIVGGTAWLFTRPEWEGVLDFLFIDEAGQVALANAVAMARSARNVVLLGDQMQLEQPVQGSHPGESGVSALQYALKDTKASRPDALVLHAVVPEGYGLFLGESRRMHPSVCSFISSSIYEGRLNAYSDCARQKIDVPENAGLVTRDCGIVFSGVEHDGNIQRSDEEVARVRAIFDELIVRRYTDTDGTTRRLALSDFLFIAPYNAQARALQEALPAAARIGSVDKFQGQEAPVCIVSLCSSFGEYGARGLAFILDKNRVNVAISRAKCLAVVVADPRIAITDAGSLEEMMLVNLFCKLSTC